MPLNFEENADQLPTTESISDKALDAVQVLRRFRTFRAPDPVFQSTRSRQIESDDFLDWSRR